MAFHEVPTFMNLPVDIRVMIYKCLLPDRPIPARFAKNNRYGRKLYMDEGSFQAPLRHDREPCNLSIFRLNHQTSREVEDTFYNQATFEIGFYHQTEFKTTGEEVNFCGRCLKWPSACSDYANSLPITLYKVQNLNVKIFAPDGDDPTLRNRVQDLLYAFVTFLRTRSPLRRLRLDVELIPQVRVQYATMDEWFEDSLWKPFDWEDPYTITLAEQTAHLLEPFHFVRHVASVRLGTLTVWIYSSSISSRPPPNIMIGIWPGTGHYGHYRQWLERLIESGEPASGLDDIIAFYKCIIPGGYPVEGGHRAQSRRIDLPRSLGNIEDVCHYNNWEERHRGTIHVQTWSCEVCLQQDPEIREKAVAVPVQYFAIPNFRRIMQGSGGPV